MNNKNREIRADEIHEIMSSPPNFLTKWGTSLVIASMAILTTLCFFLSYPQTVKGEVSISISNSRIECIIYIHQKDIHLIQKGQKAEIMISQNKERKFEGEISSISPGEKEYKVAVSFSSQSISTLYKHLSCHKKTKGEGNIIVGKFYLGKRVSDSFKSLIYK